MVDTQAAEVGGDDDTDFLGKLKQATLLLGYGEDQYGQFSIHSERPNVQITVPLLGYL